MAKEFKNVYNSVKKMFGLEFSFHKSFRIMSFRICENSVNTETRRPQHRIDHSGGEQTLDIRVDSR